MNERKIKDKWIRLLKADVTDIEVDAFVYYATEDLILGSGFGTAIAVRGGPAIQEECRQLAPVPVGEAVVTSGGQMKAGWIIHAVGPKFREENEESKLRRTMGSVLRRADEKGFRRLAFPPMGTGFYGVAPDLSAKVMLESLQEHLSGQTALEEVIICLRDARDLQPFTQRLESLGAH